MFSKAKLLIGKWIKTACPRKEFGWQIYKNFVLENIADYIINLVNLSLFGNTIIFSNFSSNSLFTYKKKHVKFNSYHYEDRFISMQNLIIKKTIATDETKNISPFLKPLEWLELLWMYTKLNLKVALNCNFSFKNSGCSTRWKFRVHRVYQNYSLILFCVDLTHMIRFDEKKIDIQSGRINKIQNLFEFTVNAVVNWI